MSYDYTQVTYCKSFDTFTSFGPVIGTEIDPDNTVIRTYLNEKKYKKAILKIFYFPAPILFLIFHKAEHCILVTLFRLVLLAMY